MVGYHRRSNTLRQSALSANTSGTVKDMQAFGDLSLFRQITQDTLDLLVQNKTKEATTRIADLEYEWDNAQATLKSRDQTKRSQIDDQIDTVLRNLRSTTIDTEKSKSSLEVLLQILQ